MSRVHGVLNYAGCFSKAAGSADRVNGWAAGLRNGVGDIHNLFFTFDGLGQSWSYIKLRYNQKECFLWCIYKSWVRILTDMPNFLTLLRK